MPQPSCAVVRQPYLTDLVHTCISDVTNHNGRQSKRLARTLAALN